MSGADFLSMFLGPLSFLFAGAAATVFTFWLDRRSRRSS